MAGGALLRHVEQTLRCRPVLSAWQRRPCPMASQGGACSRLFLHRSKLALQPACGLDRGIWLNGGIDEAALWAFVGMHNEALFREGASDPVSGGSAILTRWSSGARHGSTS
jgi:hypothetical protein